jgi:hypothetical protein
MDYIGMDLLQGDEFEVCGAEGGPKSAAVFEHVFLGVPFGEAEIEDFLAVLGADTAGLGAEAVDEPWEFCERRHLEDMDSSPLAFGPRAIAVCGGSSLGFLR